MRVLFLLSLFIHYKHGEITAKILHCFAWAVCLRRAGFSRTFIFEAAGTSLFNYWSIQADCYHSYSLGQEITEEPLVKAAEVTFRDLWLKQWSVDWIKTVFQKQIPLCKPPENTQDFINRLSLCITPLDTQLQQLAQDFCTQNIIQPWIKSFVRQISRFY